MVFTGLVWPHMRRIVGTKVEVGAQCIVGESAEAVAVGRCNGVGVRCCGGDAPRGTSVSE